MKIEQKKQIDQFFSEKYFEIREVPILLRFGGSKSFDIEGIKFEHLYAYSGVKLILTRFLLTARVAGCVFHSTENLFHI